MSKKRRSAANARGRARDRPQAAGTPRLNTAAIWRTRADVTLATQETIYAAVTRISNALATMPCRLYKETEEAVDDVRNHIMTLRPNRMMSAYSFKRAMEGYRNTEGRSYAVKLFDKNGVLCGLQVLDPASVTPMIEDVSGELWYVVRRNDGATEYLHSWYVLAMHHMSLDGVTAARLTDVLKGTIDYSSDVKTFSLENAKGVNRGLILEFPGNFSEQRRAKGVEELIGLYRKSGGQVIALESGVKATRLDGSPFDQQLFDVERITRSRVATVYNLPPHLLGETSDTTGSTIEQQNIEFLTLTMQPIVQMWEEELNYKLLTPAERRAGYAFRFDVEAYLRADSATLASRNQAAIRTGEITVNELRRKAHRPPVEGGDMPLVSKDLAPVTLVAQGATIDAAQIAGEQNSRKAG